jgi:hypothetical protein
MVQRRTATDSIWQARAGLAKLTVSDLIGGKLVMRDISLKKLASGQSLS